MANDANNCNCRILGEPVPLSGHTKYKKNILSYRKKKKNKLLYNSDYQRNNKRNKDYITKVLN